jgi:hypothetical protein
MSKKISPEEAKALSQRLMFKYKADIENINIRIQRDIDLIGFVSLETNAAKEALSAKIMKEKEKYD